jgi:hypothetical protein
MDAGLICPVNVEPQPKGPVLVGTGFCHASHASCTTYVLRIEGHGEEAWPPCPRIHRTLGRLDTAWHAWPAWTAAASGQRTERGILRWPELGTHGAALLMFAQLSLLLLLLLLLSTSLVFNLV